VDLSVSILDYEAIWIEIHSNMKQNLICGVIYRHPSSNLDSFMTYLDGAIDKINREGKLCIMMGDFDINFLNSVLIHQQNIFLICWAPIFLALVFYNLL
jgi:hypothetical protein